MIRDPRVIRDPGLIVVAAALDPAMTAGVLDLLARVEAHDGVAAVGEAGLLELRAPLHPVSHLLIATDGALAGYAWTDGVSGELAVDPVRRRRGHGGALLARLVTLHPDVAVWAHGASPAAAALAASQGLAATRELWRMRWEPAGVVVPPLAEGYAVRSFVGAADGPDGEAWVALNARTFASHPEQGRLTTADLAQRMDEPWFDPASFLLVTDGEHLAGYAWLKADGGETEVYALGVAPEHQRRGLAAHLLARAQEEARTAGARALTLHVEGDNLTAIRSYVRAGFRRDSVDLQYSVVP